VGIPLEDRLMRTFKTQTLLPALLCGAALVSFACGRGADSTGGKTGQAATETTSQTAQAPPAAVPPSANELRPEPQSVQIQEETPPAVDHGRDERAALDTQERELAAREAEIAARERRLKEREQQARSTRSNDRRPTPAPAPRDEETSPAPEPAPEPAIEEPAPAPEPAEPPVEQPRTINLTLPAGTPLDVEFTDRLASNTSAVGDTFRVRVANDIREDGVVAIPRGSEIVGVVTEAVPLPRVGGQAKLALKFTDLVLPSGSTVPIRASFVQAGRSETGRDAATVGGAAAGGAILGRILNKGSRSKGAVIGAIIGAVAGTAIASKTPGEEVVIPEGSVVGLKLNDSIEVRARPRP
jgi:type IV secretory pathway VirB10-like protein